MGKLKSFVAGSLLGGVGMYVGLQYHVLQAEEGFLFVPRAPQQRIQDAYADIRQWDAATWTARPRLALAVTEYGRGDLITEGVASSVIDDVRESLGTTQESLGKTSSGWEPATTTSTPAPQRAAPVEQSRVPAQSPSAAPVRRGFLPLAELFGIGRRPAAELPATSVMPAGVSQPKGVQILPSPGEARVLPGPNDVQLGPPGPLPGTYHGPDRRRSQASGGWEAIPGQPY